MYKKLRKSICIFAIVGIMVICNTLSVAASSILDTMQTTETTKDHAEDISYSLLRGNNLNYGVADISLISSGKINITATTQCHHVCDEVYLNMYLEQKDGGGYYTYKSWKYSTTDASHLTQSLNVLVPRGYYYRLRGYHAAADGGSGKESTTTATSGIWVD